MKKMLIKSCFSGILQAFVLNMLINFTILKITESLSLHCFIIISVITSILLASAYLFLAKSLTSNKKVLLFFLNSSFCFAVGFMVLFIINAVLPFQKCYIREINIADGIMILFVSSVFIVSCAILKLIVLLMLLVKNEKQGKS